jgi:hypothetical protein
MTNQIIPNPASAPVQWDRPGALDVEWCAERAAEAMRYLARHYPEAAGSEPLHPHQDAAHDAAVAGDEARYLEALRGFMRAGRDEALRVRERAA